MTSDDHNLRVSDEGLEAFVLCLVLGTFEAIRSKAWHPDAGIWTIGRPMFASMLKSLSIPQHVVAVIELADEHSAIQELSGMEAYTQLLDASIDVLTERLKEIPDQYWQAGWTDSTHGENAVE